MQIPHNFPQAAQIIKAFGESTVSYIFFLYTSVHCDRASGLQVACFEHICCNITVVIVVALCSGLTEPT